MELNELVAASIADTKGSLWPAFGPELILCGTIFLMLIVRLFRATSWFSAFWVALPGTIAALACTKPWTFLSGAEAIGRHELFTGMLVSDAFAVYVRAILVVFAILFVVFTKLSGIPDRQDSPDFYCLVLGSIIGMCLMASANHLLVVFLAVEMASVPSYALAAMMKGKRSASEAALKYSIYGAAAAGVMLYGISLLAGLLNSAHFPTMAAQLAELLPTMAGPQKMVLVLAALMVMVGLAFKLSAVPFHFWCPDVFEGASAEVNAFLSVASKAAALALLVRVCIGLGTVPPVVNGPPSAIATPVTISVSLTDQPLESPLLASVDAAAPATGAATTAALEPVRNFMALLIAFLAAITCTFGNLAAYGQTNIKRLLAYSTIAHAGYMMMPVPAALTLMKTHPQVAEKAIAALAIYMGFYLFMNLGAFAVVAFLRNNLRSEEIADYAGLVHRSPVIVVCFALMLFSLVGIPPLAGFIGKFLIFASLAEGYQASGRFYLIMLLVVGGINTVISLFYYLRVAKVMAIDPPAEGSPRMNWSMLSLSGVFVVLITLPLILFFVNWDVFNEWTLNAAKNLF